MHWQRILLLSCLILTVNTMRIPSWESLQVMLHEKLEDIYQNDKAEVHKKLQSGRFFKYYLPAEVGEYKATEEGYDGLPRWLTFDPSKKKLQGVPLENDIQKGLRISFVRTDKESSIDTKTLILDIAFNPEPFNCKDSVTVASVIFHADLNSMTPHKQLGLLRNFSRILNDVTLHSLHIEHGNKMGDDSLLNSQMLMAGPGDKKLSGNQPGFTVSWKLKCGSDISGNRDVITLRSYSQKEDFSSMFCKPVLGWFITSKKPQRKRRAVNLGGTLGATPSLSVQGTPTLVPSASVVTKSSIKVSVSPSKSVPMTKTSAVPTTMPPVITTVETTTTTTTTESTTEEPTTKQSTSVSMTPALNTTKFTEESTQKPTTTIRSTLYKNKSPQVNTEFKFLEIQVQENSPTLYQVPSGLFTDVEELSIQLIYLAPGAKFYSEVVPSWVKYIDVDGEGNPARKLYIFPTEKDIEKHHFGLKAKDSFDLSNTHFFSIVVSRDPTKYKFKFNVTIDMKYYEVAEDLITKMKLLERLAQALGGSSVSELKDVMLYEGSVIVEWGVQHLSNKSCNDPELQSYNAKLKGDRFREDMSPEYTVVGTGVVSASNCELIEENLVPKDDSIWERILIPVIVIVIILLIIALILCCVYRRKRKYETAEEQDETYLNHKKPVIFLEEYEDKPDFVSLQPLVLPNEKPPATDQSYDRRGDSPQGQESSTTADTESDENAPLAPKSPKDNRGGYNAPPPYSAR